MGKLFEIIGTIVVSVGGTGVIIIGFSSWIAKILANKLYEKERKKQEKYLKDIQNKLDSKLAELNNKLEKSKIQFEILNKERIEVIRCLYTKLVDMQDFLGIYFREVIANNKKNATIEDFNLLKAVSDFMDYNNHNRIFFSENICESIEQIDAILIIILDMHSRLIQPHVKKEELNKKMIELINKMIKKEIPKFKRELEYEFRRMIGVFN